MLGSAWLLLGRKRNLLNPDRLLRVFEYPVGDARGNRR